MAYRRRTAGGEPSVTDQVPTTCVRCAVGCGHVQQAVDQGYGLDLVRGDPSHPVNRGLACQRGVSETADPDGEWLTRPLVRTNGELTATTWDVALSAAAEGIASAAERDPDSVAVLGSGQQTNEAAYALGKLARAGIGTKHYDANTTLCMASAVTAYYDAFGSDAPPPTYDDIPEADTHLVWGANPAAAHPVMFRWIADSAADDGSELLVVDPVGSETAEVADEHVAPDPGTDLALARAVLARVVDTDRVDDAFVERATAGFDDLRAALPDAAEAAETAGVSADTVDRLAAALADDTLLYWGMGVNQSTQGTATAGALVDLCLATGNLGPGTGPFSLTGQANSMGTRVCSSKGTWPGHRPFDDPDAREAVASAWDVPVAALAADTGPGPVGIVDAIGDDVDVCWTVATNPAAGLPDATRARERLDDAFLVVQDAFRSETVEHADVVLPAATWGETDGTVTNMERRVSRVRPATDTPSGVRSDLNIIAAIAARVAPDLLGRPPVDPEAVFDELADLTAGTPADMSGIGYDRLDAAGAVRWPAPDAETEGGYRYHDDGDWSFPTPSGRARFSTATHAGVPEPPDDEYPLTLTTAREADAYNTGVRARGDSPTARLSPATAAAFEGAVTADGDDAGGDPHADARVTVVSRRGSVEAAVAVDDGVPDGVVWLPIHHPAVNDLTLPATDPRSDEPNFKQCAVRLARPEQSPERAAEVPQ